VKIANIMKFLLIHNLTHYLHTDITEVRHLQYSVQYTDI